MTTKEDRIKALEEKLEILRRYLENISIQDIDEFGEPESARHMANHVDAVDLADALSYCAKKARDALALYDSEDGLEDKGESIQPEGETMRILEFIAEACKNTQKRTLEIVAEACSRVGKDEASYLVNELAAELRQRIE